MPTLRAQLRRSLVAAAPQAREYAHAGERLSLDTDHPVLAHIIPTRRCNLSCTYCNEYDDFSKPVPTDEMLRRIDLLADLGTSIISFSGGEPLLHPDLDDLIVRIRQHGAMAGMITNGYLLNCGPHPAAEPGRAGSHADFDRQRHAGRRLEEEPEDAG